MGGDERGAGMRGDGSIWGGVGGVDGERGWDESGWDESGWEGMG